MKNILKNILISVLKVIIEIIKIKEQMNNTILGYYKYLPINKLKEICKVNNKTACKYCNIR